MTAVSLVSTTPNAEKHILFCARVSSNQENGDPGLLGYLIRNRHWSPFEMAHMVLEIRTSRAIAQQILRHRSFSFQEFSQRYAEAQTYIIYGARVKNEGGNRQGSTEIDDPELAAWWARAQMIVGKKAFETYHDALSRGIAPEVARFVLPLSTETTLYMSGSLRSWIHYLEQRIDPHTQREHRELALAAQQLFIEQFPVISEALNWIGTDEDQEMS